MIYRNTRNTSTFFNNIFCEFFVSGTQLAYLFIDHQFVSLDHNKKENEEKYFFTNNLIVVFLLLSRNKIENRDFIHPPLPNTVQERLPRLKVVALAAAAVVLDIAVAPSLLACL